MARFVRSARLAALAAVGCSSLVAAVSLQFTGLAGAHLATASPAQLLGLLALAVLPVATWLAVTADRRIRASG
ncbi:MAG: hypothetical protein IBJ11_06025 [Phycisphaerales bacterium]|nr:hypothetical protein [Phycisphaerales bacterium]